MRINKSSDTVIAGSSPELKCIVQFNTAVDVPLIIKNMWLGPNGVAFSYVH